MMQNWQKKRVLIIGAARQGLALARFLARNGAVVTLNDVRQPDQMESARAALNGLQVRWELGGHPLELLDGQDLVCISGGVPLDNPLVAEAIRLGMPLSNDSQIFMQNVDCPVIGITGSAGKTTTTTLVGRMAQVAVQPPKRAWVGGNIGNPLIDQLDEIGAEDVVVLELSSFQLEIMTRSPQVAGVLNITPNHLDRHETLEAYTAAKARILDYQTPMDVAVLNRDDPGAYNLLPRVRGRLVTFGFQRPEVMVDGTYLDGGRIYMQSNRKIEDVLAIEEINLRGEHNQANVLAACAIGLSAGFPVQAVRAGVIGFRGVAHRLEYVRTWKGADWYNDSIATAPERTKAAIMAFDEPIVLLLGGRDKKLPWDDLAELVRKRVDHVVVFGEAAPIILSALEAAAGDERPFSIKTCRGLEEAVKAASRVVEEGDVVLFSPGGTSFDQFTDFEERGEAYRLWVNRLP